MVCKFLCKKLCIKTLGDHLFFLHMKKQRALFFPNNELIIFDSFKFCVKVDVGNMQQEYFLSGFSDWWMSE